MSAMTVVLSEMASVASRAAVGPIRGIVRYPGPDRSEQFIASSRCTRRRTREGQVQEVQQIQVRCTAVQQVIKNGFHTDDAASKF